MRVQFDPEFYKLYKEANVRIRNEVDRKIELFKKDPYNSELNNHELHDEYEGFKSIDITNDYRAIYQEVPGVNEPVAYFSLLGSHKELYKVNNMSINGSETYRERIAREKREKALQEILAAEPTFTNVKDGTTYVRELRKIDKKRVPHEKAA